VKPKTKSRPELYGTAQVAEILGIPEWRVKNFSEGATYRLPPAHRIGKGRGSRRLYGWEDIFRIAIAEHLVKCGFTAESVGRAVREVPESVLAPYSEFLRMEERNRENLTRKETPLLVSAGGAWKVRSATETSRTIKQTVTHQGSAEGLFVVNLANLCDEAFRRLYDYWCK
jgi:DNA-binding transcriptional MerR regulator